MSNNDISPAPNGWTRVQGYEPFQRNLRPHTPTVRLEGLTGTRALLVLEPLSRRAHRSDQSDAEISPWELADLGIACLCRAIRASLQRARADHHEA